ncbi:hypothetical protein [Deinococcus sp.]|nr:hypothetical protein [Deinococcus sp.]
MPEFITGLDHVQIEAPAGCEAAARGSPCRTAGTCTWAWWQILSRV